MKIANHQLKGSRALILCGTPKMRIPLQANIDYLGFRVEASACIPIPNDDEVRKQHLVYGSLNRGKDIKISETEINEEMSQIGKQLNLKEHFVKGMNNASTTLINLSADIQVYKYDSLYYIMNTFRICPPEDTSVVDYFPEEPRGQSIFWRLLRLELIKVKIEIIKRIIKLNYQVILSVVLLSIQMIHTRITLK